MSAKFLLTDVYILFDGVNLSNYGFNIDTPSVRDQIEVSGFSSTGAKEFLAGQRDDSVTAQFTQDFASGGPHDIIYYVYINKLTVPLVIKPTSSAVGVNNPSLSGNVQVFSYNGLSGALNARSEITVEFKAADAAGLLWSNT